MQLKKLIPKVSLIFSLLTVTTMTFAHPSLLTEIVNKYNSPASRTTQTDVTQELQKYIPIGTTVEKAKAALAADGFKVTMKQVKGVHYLSGSKELGRSILGFDEARLTMTVVDGKIATSHGSIFRHTL